jgi:hypothetical protein
VEGKEDPCFYRGFIHSILPSGWKVELWAAGNKDRVYEIHKLLDWRRFSKRRISFFADRDLSDILPEKLTVDANIYVTSGYSIENDVVSGEVCNRVLTELCGLSTAGHGELESVEALFKKELDIYARKLIPIMAWIVAWKRGGERPNLNEILMRDLFYFSNGKIQEKQRPSGKSDFVAYIHERCGVAFDPNIDVNPIADQLMKKSPFEAFARGKYVFWFLVEFCISANRDFQSLFPSIGKKPKMTTQLSISNGIALIGPRARLPESLRVFLEANYAAYIERANRKLGR